MIDLILLAVCGALIAGGMYLLRWHYDGPVGEKLCWDRRIVQQHLPAVRLSPDSILYLNRGLGRAVPAPFCFRWLLPTALGNNMFAWHALSAGSLIGIGAVLPLYLYILGHTLLACLVGVCLYTGLWGVFGMQVRHPILVDPPALFLALSAALLAITGAPFEIIVGVSLLAGSIKENAPIQAALFSLSPLPLLGLIAPLCAWFLAERGPTDNEFMLHPFRAAKAHFNRRFFRPWLVLTWGGVGLAAILNPSGWLLLTLLALLTYILFVSDACRAWHTAFPVVIAHALLIPPYLFPLLVILQWVNPWQAPEHESQAFKIED